MNAVRIAIVSLLLASSSAFAQDGASREVVELEAEVVRANAERPLTVLLAPPKVRAQTPELERPSFVRQIRASARRLR